MVRYVSKLHWWDEDCACCHKGDRGPFAATTDEVTCKHCLRYMSTPGFGQFFTNGRFYNPR